MDEGMIVIAREGNPASDHEVDASSSSKFPNKANSRSQEPSQYLHFDTPNCIHITSLSHSNTCFNQPVLSKAHHLFLAEGVWEMEVGSANRIRSCALDLLAMVGEMVMEEGGGEEDEEGWDLMGRDLRLKTTFLYCDFTHLISAAPDIQKQPLTDIANRLFQYIHELDNAVKIRSVPLTQHRYSDAALVLQEVMALMS